MYRRFEFNPAYTWEPIALVSWLPAPPPIFVFYLVDVVFMVGLFALLLGYRTRVATGVVLVAGTFADVFTNSFGKVDHVNTLLAFYIPLVMLFSRWGDTFSVDAVRRARRGKPPASIYRNGFEYSWVIKFLLVLLAALYLSAGLLKIMGTTPWLLRESVVANIMLRSNNNVILGGGTSSPLVIALWNAPWTHNLLRWGTIALELLFPLALFHRNLRGLFLSAAVLFHTAIFFLMGVSFSRQLIIYSLFVNLVAVYLWVVPRLRVGRWQWVVWLRTQAVKRPLALIGVVALVWFTVPVMQLALEIVQPFTLFLFTGVVGLVAFVRVFITTVQDVTRAIRAPLTNRRANEPNATT